jgi:PAS domain S-box-containing protein
MPRAVHGMLRALAAWYNRDGQLMANERDLAELESLAAQNAALAKRIEELERRLRESAEDTVRRSEAQLNEAQRIAHVGSWDWDIKNDVISWTDELYRIFGLDRAQFGASYDRYLERIHEADRENVRQIIQRAYEQREPFSFEHRVVRPDGEVRTLLGRGRVFVDAKNVPIRMAGTGQDITEQKELEQQLVFAGRMAAVGTLASGVAHEINNPLAYVLGNLELAALRLGDLTTALAGHHASTALEDIAHLVADAQHGAERMRDIVSDLRVFSRADREELGAVDVHRVLDSSIHVAWNEIRHRARLTKDFGEVRAAHANESRVGQLFLNLLVNAAHAIPEGAAQEHEIRVATRMDPNGRFVIVEIRDTGGGIAPELRSRIFDPFFTTKPVGGGTGLGLSICRTIATSLGGRIDCESELGKGSMFRVALPVASCAPDPKVERAPLPSSHTRGRILVIDDDPQVLVVVRRILERDHELATCASVSEAEALIAAHRFDVILCDLMMPQKTGMDLYEALLASTPDAAARMAFMTGGAFTPRARDFLERITHPSIEKPFTIAQLLSFVERLLARHER